MGRKVKARASCPNAACEDRGNADSGTIVLHGFSRVKWGKRRRYRCTACGRTFGSTTGTPYERLQRPRAQFDRVAALSVEGMSKAAIARIEGLCWNTVSRWLELAASIARQFNNAKTRGYAL